MHMFYNVLYFLRLSAGPLNLSDTKQEKFLGLPVFSLRVFALNASRSTEQGSSLIQHYG